MPANQPLVLLALACATLSASPARADSIAGGYEGRFYSYELTGLDVVPGHVVIAYPVLCDPRTGRSVAAEVASGQRELAALLDYEVLRAGRRYHGGHHCHESRLYVVDITGWKVEPIAAAPGRSEDEHDLLHIAALDALEVDGRDRFFRDDPRVHATGFVLERHGVVPEGDPLREVHDVLELARVGEEFRVQGRQVTYTYRDGTRQVLAYANGQRPQPAGKGDLPPDPSWLPAPESEPPPGEAADAHVPEDIPPEPPPAPAPDRKPAWLWPLAAVLLVVAGLAGLRLTRRPGPRK